MQDYVPFTFKGSQSMKNEMIALKDENNMILGYFGNHKPSDTAPHHRLLKYSATSLLEPQMMGVESGLAVLVSVASLLTNIKMIVDILRECFC